MTHDSQAILEQLLRDNDLGSLIDIDSPSQRVIRSMLRRLDKLTATYRTRFPDEMSFAPENLQLEAERNPHKIRAFLQAFVVSNTPEMQLMVWRILQGSRIREVVMSYRELETFSLSVTLAGSGQNQDELETYRTEDIHDSALLRNFGIVTVHEKPLFVGFFPGKKR